MCNKMKRKAAIILLFIFAGITVFFAFPKNDGCELLDKKLGEDAQSPTKLLEVIAWEYNDDSSKNPHALGFSDFFDIRHQALVKLLAIQHKVFGDALPEQHHKTLRVDHSGARVIEENTDIVIVEGSSSIFPDEVDEPNGDGYYRWEHFTFDRSGKLISRSAISQ